MSRDECKSSSSRDVHRIPLLRDMSRDGCKNLSSKDVRRDASRSMTVEMSL